MRCKQTFAGRAPAMRCCQPTGARKLSPGCGCRAKGLLGKISRVVPLLLYYSEVVRCGHLPHTPTGAGVSTGAFYGDM